MFTKVCSCSYPKPDQSNRPPFSPIYLKSSILLFSHLHLGLPKGLFPSGYPAKILYFGGAVRFILF
jgi:hypothetical protein